MQYYKFIKIGNGVQYAIIDGSSYKLPKLHCAYSILLIYDEAYFKEQKIHKVLSRKAYKKLKNKALKMDFKKQKLVLIKT